MLRQRMLPRFVLIAVLLLTLCAGCQAREQLEQPNSATAALSKPDAAPNSVMFDSSPDIWQAVNQAVPMLVPYEHADQQNRHLLVDTKPDPYTTPPETVLFDDLLSDSSADLLPTDSRVAKKGAGCDVPNQVHLTYWSPTSVLVSWITCDAQTGPQVTGPKPRPVSTSLSYWKARDCQASSKHCRSKRAVGVTTSYFSNYTASAPETTYASGIIHHVLLQDLDHGVKYTYKLEGETSSRTFTFQMPRCEFPFRLGVVSDPGQTANSSLILDRMVEEQPEMVSMIGDYAYADDWANWTHPSTSSRYMSWQPKWDSWGNLYEPLLSTVPFLHTMGNHEIEPEWLSDDPTVETARMRSYNHRYPVPQTDRQRRNGPSTFGPATSADPWRNLYWSVELPGVFTVIHLTHYSPGQQMTETEQQYTWLEKELENVDRKKTPWLIVNWHGPWYNTYTSHFKENDAMRQTYEPLLIKHNVDIVFNGHVHAYERKKPIVNNKVDIRGPVSITIGDGGTGGGLAKAFIDLAPRDYCPSGAGYTFRWYQPSPPSEPFMEPTGDYCADNIPGCFCYSRVPDWSGHREPSYGYGILTFQSATHAKWEWKVNQKPAFMVSDTVTLIRRGRRRGMAG